MGDLDESTRNWNKRAALEEIESLKAARSTAWDEHTHSFRWLMASLLAVNGGACLSVFDKVEVLELNRLAACGSFVVGVLAALLVAVFGQRSVQKSFAPLNGLIGYWMTVADDGLRDEEIEKGLSRDLEKSAKAGLASRAAGWVSALAFLLGAVSVGLGSMPDDNQSSDTLEAPADSVEMPADASIGAPNENADQSIAKQVFEKVK